MLFSGGLIPWYLTIRTVGLLDTIWALVLPGAVPIFSVVLLLNFFRGLPRELEEAAYIDGAGHWVTLWRIFLPVSMPAIATITLFSFVQHWNAWFDGLILMNSVKNYPLQSYLQTYVIEGNMTDFFMQDFALLDKMSERTIKSALIVSAMAPVVIVFPLLQRFLAKGL